MQLKYFKFFKYCKFLLRKMLPQEFETIEAEVVPASEQDVQPYFEHHLWSEYCCTTLIENFYVNVLEKKTCLRRWLHDTTYIFWVRGNITRQNRPHSRKRLVLYLKALQPRLLPLWYGDFLHAAKSRFIHNLCRTCNLFIPTRSII